MKNKLFFTLLLIVGLVLLKTNTAFTQAGTLDSTFSGDGKVTTSTNGSLHSSFGESVAIRSNGKIIVAGCEIYDIPGLVVNPNYKYNRFVVVQYNFTGSLDTDFGDGDRQASHACY